MKQISLAISMAVFAFALLLAPTASAQAPAAPTAPSLTGKVVVIYLYALSDSYNPSFDTGGELVDGLNSSELSRKYYQTSFARVINFMVDKGYRIVSCVAKPAPIINNSGGGLEGYTVLMEKVR
jgi:hypothetical protein